MAKKPFLTRVFAGAPERTRISGLLLRRQTLYPTELRAHVKLHIRAKTKITYSSIRRKTILIILAPGKGGAFLPARFQRTQGLLPDNERNPHSLPQYTYTSFQGILYALLLNRLLL